MAVVHLHGAEADLTRQLLVLSAVAVVMTVGVYGLVAGIVKLDDAGLYLSRKPGLEPLYDALSAYYDKLIAQENMGFDKAELADGRLCEILPAHSAAPIAPASPE